MLQVIPLPVLQDNYVYILLDQFSGKCAVVDPGDAKPVIDFLQKHTLHPDFILLTHHHFDHIGGVDAIHSLFHSCVVGFAGDKHRLPPLDKVVEDNTTFSFGSQDIQVLHVPGHTLGHIAYWLPQNQVMFVGDTLFSAGCGRLFEGTPEQMWQSVSRITSFPGETLLYCGHEYTEKNVAFALTVEPDNKALRDYHRRVMEKRAHCQPTLPTTISIEKEVNPFLRVQQKTIREKYGLLEATDAGVFGFLRRLKDNSI